MRYGVRRSRSGLQRTVRSCNTIDDMTISKQIISYILSIFSGSWQVSVFVRLKRIHETGPPTFKKICPKTLSSADKLCKQIGPRSGPTMSGLIWIQTI